MMDVKRFNVVFWFFLAKSQYARSTFYVNYMLIPGSAPSIYTPPSDMLINPNFKAVL